MKNFIAKQSTEVIVNTILESNRICIPLNIRKDDFYKSFKVPIETSAFTTEKAIYSAALGKTKEKKTLESLLVNGR